MTGGGQHKPASPANSLRRVKASVKVTAFLVSEQQCHRQNAAFQEPGCGSGVRCSVLPVLSASGAQCSQCSVLPVPWA